MTENQNETPDEPQDDALAQAERILNESAADLAADEAGADDALGQAELKAAEHLADLQRLQAEYVNYRKRVDRDRELIGTNATAKAVEALIPTLDDIAAAREHGDLAEGPFAAIAAKLEAALAGLGWSSYGAAGDVFDPQLHEALMSQPSTEVTEPTVQHVAQPGHKVGERVLRPARVIVAQPE
ncbi:nucleotide exchange factor GrpE [Demequina soli]|uniref:nucleotide exchange factor GrpE n=1 Tax=Demequina soli TaxID=1638987 RepID=UPI000782F6FD|nr:nucleotide exchange factor GrpE [Demequina soli]